MGTLAMVCTTEVAEYRRYILPVDALKQRPAVAQLHRHLQRLPSRTHAPKHVQNGRVVEPLHTHKCRQGQTVPELEDVASIFPHLHQCRLFQQKLFRSLQIAGAGPQLLDSHLHTVQVRPVQLRHKNRGEGSVRYQI